MPLDVEQSQMEKRGVLGWLEAHGPLILGIFAAIAAGYYLIFRPSSTATPAAATLPTSSGGGGGTSGGGTTSGGTSAPALPYNPDFGVLGNITDEALRRLYEQEYNLEVSINNAVTQGNTALVNQLTASLGVVQSQISGYQPAAPAATTTPSTVTPSGNTADAWNTVLSNIWQNFAGAIKPGTVPDTSSTFGQGWINTVADTFKVPTDAATGVYNEIINNPSYFQSGKNASGSPIWDTQKIANALNGQVAIYNANLKAATH